MSMVITFAHRYSSTGATQLRSTLLPLPQKTKTIAAIGVKLVLRQNAKARITRGNRAKNNESSGVFSPQVKEGIVSG